MDADLLSWAKALVYLGMAVSVYLAARRSGEWAWPVAARVAVGAAANLVVIGLVVWWGEARPEQVVAVGVVVLAVALMGPALIAWWCVRYLQRLKREAGLQGSYRSSNDPTFDPNVGAGGGPSWQRMEPAGR